MSDFTFGAGRELDVTPANELSYEDARDELASIVRALELGNMSLDESLRLWERGEELARRCETYLEGARNSIEKALGENSAEAASAPNEESDETSTEV